MIVFIVGSHVRWVRALSDGDRFGSVGIVLAVIPDEHGIAWFTRYDVQFSFGRFRLYGTQLEYGKLRQLTEY